MQKLKSYFHIENEKNLQVSLMGKYEIKCTNLTLKTEKVNTKDQMIHIQACQIGNIQIVFDSGRILDSPLSIIVDKVNLILKFNTNKVQAKKEASKKVREELYRFNQAIGNQNQFKERNFFQEELYQFKRMITEFCIKKLSLLITNIDVSIEYVVEEQKKYFGLTIDEIQLKQRVVINTNMEHQRKTEQLNCLLRGIGLYVGVAVEEKDIKQEAKHREIIRRKFGRKKKYLMKKTQISAFYNLEQNRISISNEQINLELLKIVFFEAGVFLEYIKPLLSVKPPLRPGQGKIIQIGTQIIEDQKGTKYDKKIKVSEGTLSWWQRIGNRIIDKFHSKQNMNILRNKKFRRYLYCLLYRYTYGAKPQLEKIIDEYEFFKTSLQIMKYYKFILQKMDRIQRTKGTIIQLKGFVYFLRSIAKFDKRLKALKLRKIQYEDIVNSNIIINYRNCQRFLELYEMQLKDHLSFFLHFNSINVMVQTSTFLKNFEKEVESITPQEYQNLKKVHLNQCCHNFITSNDDEADKSTDFIISISGFQFEYNHQGNTYLEIKNSSTLDLVNKIRIWDFRKFLMKKENLYPEEYKWAVLAQSELSFSLDFLYLHLDARFVSHLLTISTFLNTEKSNREQQFSGFLDTFIIRKIPQHQILNTYSNTTKKILIKQCMITTPVLDEERVLQIDLSEINLKAPVNQKSHLSLKNFLIIRSHLGNVREKLDKAYRKQYADQSIILANNRPFSGYSYENGYDTTTSILIPFMLVQISSQDLYYFFNIMKIWKKLFDNEFFFPPLKKKTRKVQQKISEAALKFSDSMDKIVKYKKITEIKMEGIQYSLTADQITNGNDGKNNVMNIMLDTLLFEKQQNYSFESVEILIKDIFVVNTLGKRKINKQSLVKSIKRTLAFDDQSILDRQGLQQQSEPQLLFYTETYQESERKKPFLSLNIKSSVNLPRMKKQTVIDVNIKPVFIFHCPQFFEALMAIINISSNMAKDTVNGLPKKIFQHDYPRKINFSEEPEILISEDFSHVQKLTCQIRRVNILIVTQPHVSFSISLKSFSFEQQIEPYLNKITFEAKRFCVVDTHPSSGPYPILIDGKNGITGTLTMYHSWILKQKYKKASLLQVKIDKPKIFFLKKKVMEFVNLIMITLKQIYPPEIKEKQIQKDQENDEVSYGFCYDIQLNNSKIILLRGSLSQEGFKSQAGKIVVKNFVGEADEEQKMNQNFQCASFSVDQQQYEEFQSCSQFDQSSYQFRSFHQNQEKNLQKSGKISIQIYNFSMFRSTQGKQNEVALNIDVMGLDFISPKLIIEIPQVTVSLDQNDYRVLIRMTQENLGQSPIIFLNKTPPKPEVSVSFQTVFFIEKVDFFAYQEKQMLFQLQMHSLRGNNLILTNGENQTELLITQMLAKSKVGSFVIVKNKPQQIKHQISMARKVRLEDFPALHEIDLQNRNILYEIESDQQKLHDLMKHSIIQQGKYRGNQRQETNSQKICKWFQGMCQKCCCCFTCCCKKGQQSNQFIVDILHTITEKQLKKNALQHSEQIFEGEGNLDSTTIQSFQDILEFRSKINSQHIIDHERQVEERNMIYLDFLIKPWGQKHMYMLVKDKSIILEKNKTLNSMISFFYKPYQFPEIPFYFRFPKFNNFRPFKMLIKLTNSVCEMIHSPQENQEDKIIIPLDVIYQSQRKGDTTNGPGRSKMKIQAILQVLFFNKQFQKFNLSDPIQAIYLSEQAVPYGKENNTKFNQKIVLTHATHTEDHIAFNIPAFLIKRIQKIFQHSFSSSQNQKPDKMNDSRKPQKRVDQAQNMKQKPIVPQKDWKMSRSILIPKIKFKLEVKPKSALIQTVIKNIKMGDIIINQGETKLTKRNINSVLEINYLNLKLNVFEPFIEEWTFKLVQILNQRGQISGSNLKISSNIENNSWKVKDDYINDLNINFSLAFFHTLKELQIKYEQGVLEKEQYCIDLTNSQNYNQENLVISSRKVSEEYKVRFPEHLKIFFTREFDFEGEMKSKKVRDVFQKDSFNPPELRVHLFHSYFDHHKRRKKIVYRTPYRIFNCTKTVFNLSFYIPRTNHQWAVRLDQLQYYALPNQIYTVDFLVNINQTEIEKIEEAQNMKYSSVMYLMQIKASKSDFVELKSTTKIWKQVFKYSHIDKVKFIDPRDFVIRTKNGCYSIITVKSEYLKPFSLQSQRNVIEGNLKLYDSYCILFSPVIIYNYTRIHFKIIVNHQLYIRLDWNKKVEINEQLAKDVEDTVIQFEEDHLHQQFKFLNLPLGIHHKKIELQKLQKVNLVIYRETISTCFVEIYADWNITNYTNQDFCLMFGNNLFFIDKKSFCCLSDISDSIHLSIVNEREQEKKISRDNLENNITLAKKIMGEEYEELLQKKLNFQSEKCCSCSSSPQKIYESIDFVFSSQTDPLYPLLSKKIEIKYRYQIRNLSRHQINLFQYSSEFLIRKIRQEEIQYIFFYDFLPQQFFLKFVVDDQQVSSCFFELDKFPGKSFALKFKKNDEAPEYRDRFEYLRIEVQKIGDQSIIEIEDADFEDFPIYLDNLTDHVIKITEGEQSFILLPKKRIPFAWSDLMTFDQKLDVQIEGCPTKTYYLGQKSEFQPIKIMQKQKNMRNFQPNVLYRKEACRIYSQHLELDSFYQIILDMFDNNLRIHKESDDINIQVNLDEAFRMQTFAEKIQLYFPQNKSLEIFPSSKTINGWGQDLHYCINRDVVDKVFFTIQSYKNSRIFFFRTLAESDLQSSKLEVSIGHLNISLINFKPEEVILFYIGGIIYSQHDRSNKLNYKDLLSKKSQRVITIRKLKINNQMKNAVNPVVLSQIKKSETPFLEVRLSKENIEKKGEIVDESEEKIIHYEQITFFLDEAELMLEAALFFQLFSVKGSYEDLQKQYTVGPSENLDNYLVVLGESQKKVNNPQVYINCLDLQPLKMTISVYLQHNQDEQVKMNALTILRYIPFGIENAIIKIDAYQYFHIFYDQRELTRTLTNYYIRSIRNQMLINAGSYDMFVTIKLVQGLGIGVKNIVYDPLYEFSKKKQIKALTTTCLEGLISLIVFILSIMVQIINLAFKVLAAATFDTEYKTKRDMFRKQIFKSPSDGFIYGLRYSGRVFTSFFNIIKTPRNINRLSFWILLSFVIAGMKVIPWVLKIIITIYDLFYVIGLGILNWGYYEEYAMSFRSRPPRVFPHKQLVHYEYLQALASELIGKYQIEAIEKQKIHFVDRIYENDENHYLILSNYRIIYNNSTLSNCQEIKLYQVGQVEVQQVDQTIKVKVRLAIPNKDRFCCIDCTVGQFSVPFNMKITAKEFVKKLNSLSTSLNLNIQFDMPEQFKMSMRMTQALTEVI